MSRDLLDERTADAADHLMDWCFERGVNVLIGAVIVLSLVCVVAQVGMKGDWW